MQDRAAVGRHASRVGFHTADPGSNPQSPTFNDEFPYFFVGEAANPLPDCLDRNSSSLWMNATTGQSNRVQPIAGKRIKEP